MPNLKATYYEQLKLPKWRLKRKQILERDKNACRNCGRTADLQVHHRQYQTMRKTGQYLAPWLYDTKYLVTLCEKCHRTGHELYAIPVKFI